MQEQLQPKSTIGMHRYVLGFVGIFLLIAASYPIAFIRVSQTKKLSGYHVKSLSMDGKPLQQSNLANDHQPVAKH